MSQTALTSMKVSGPPAHRPVSPPPKGWPSLSPDALIGPAGELVTLNDPYTEADPVAVLIQFLVGFGSVIGDSAHFQVEHKKHPARLFVALVGETGKSRKGQSWSTPHHVLQRIDKDWARVCCLNGGLSSAEGLINAVRDPNPPEDPGVLDKRLLVIEEEFAQVFHVARREGNTLHNIIRQSWDNGNLRPLTKLNAIQVTGAHISIIGHITKDELLSLITQTHQANGFANRFLWTCVRRSKSIPSGKRIPDEILSPLIGNLTDAAARARTVGEVLRDAEAEELWCSIYDDLATGKPGLLGAITGRGEPQVMRLALIYALLDQSPVVKAEHLKAALSLWGHSESSARFIFGDKIGDLIADTILQAGRLKGPLSETAIHDLFHRNKKREEIDPALDLLRHYGLAKTVTVETGGRHTVLWEFAP